MVPFYGMCVPGFSNVIFDTNATVHVRHIAAILYPKSPTVAIGVQL